MMTSKMSYYHKPRPNSLDNRRVFEILDAQASRIPHKELMVFFDEQGKRSSLTFLQFKDRTRSLALALAERGIIRGDRVAICAPNCYEFAISMLALSRIGACAVLTCPFGLTQERESLLRQLKCEAVIFGLDVDSKERERTLEVLHGLVALNTDHNNFLKLVVLIGGDETTKSTIQHGNVSTCADLLEKGSHMDTSVLDDLEIQVNSEDLFLSILSSGTTGQPKALGYTQHAIVNGVNIDVNGGYEEDSVTFSGWPMSWGCEAPIFIAAIVIGFTFVTTLFSKITPEDSYHFMLKIIEEEKCDDCCIPQQDVAKMVSENFQEKYDLSSVEAFGYGGQIVPRKTMRSLLNVFPSKFAVLVYASVEVFTVGIQPLSKENIDSDEYGKMYILPDIEVKVVNEDGLVVPLGTKGEICVRGAKTFKEYLGKPEATSKAKTKTGWVYTQDFGIMYEGGKIKVLGRESDIILRGGVKMFPVEFEDALQEHPDITDVVIVGVPDEDLNQELCACVIEAPGSNLSSRVPELENWCAKQLYLAKNVYGLAPKYFVFMDEFPVKESSKIHRHVMERLAAERLGLLQH